MLVAFLILGFLAVRRCRPGDQRPDDPTEHSTTAAENEIRASEDGLRSILYNLAPGRAIHGAMSVAVQLPMTLAEFLAWEERQELRYEFDGSEPVAMTGGTVAHDQITFDLRTALVARLAGKRCRALGPNVKIIVDGRTRYPDAFVVCQPVSPTATIAGDPVVVFEVLSEGSSETDLIEKNREYRATPSIQRYVVLQQTHKAAVVFVRQDRGWLSEIVSGDDAILHLPEIDIAVPLHEVYANSGVA